MSMRRPLRAFAAAATGIAIVSTATVLLSGGAEGAQFTGGNLVVYRVGTGTGALTNAAAPVFLDEFTPGGAQAQSIALPTAAASGNLPLTAAGQSRSEGLISRSLNKNKIA